jgi:thiamine biosynthesis lipoprotein
MNGDGARPVAAGLPPVRYVVSALLIALLVVAAVLLRGRNLEPRVHRFDGQTMGTTYNVVIVERSDRPGAADAMLRAVTGELDLVNMTMSRFQKDSELYRFNELRSTAPFAMSGSALRVIRQAQSLSERTGGAYDVTVTPLVRLWGFSDRTPRLAPPTDEELAAARAKVGWDKVTVDLEAGTIAKAIPELEIDLSSIAKGAGVDRIAAALSVYKHTDFMVEVGGEVRCRGKSPRGTPWRIGIEKPLPGEREIYEVLELHDAAMATSGDYRNYYDLDGRRLSHTIDPRTGRPIEHGLASVTVVHDECAVADGLATALTVLGPVEGFDVAQREGLKAMFIVREPDGTLTRRATAAYEALGKAK